MKPLRGVCVGAGYFSRFQYEAWNRIPEVEIVGICNRSVEKAQAMAKDFDIPHVYGVDAFDAMLDQKKPDFIDIITPPETHLHFCKHAAERGIHIICQKPLAPTYEETLELVEVAKASSGRFMVHENFRWQPWYREMKRLLDKGLLGNFYHCAVQSRLGDGWGEDAYLARQPFFREYPRLYIFETGVHFLDTFRYLFGEPTSLYARISQRNPVIEGEDSALLVCEFPDGGRAVLDANRYNECETEDPRYTFGKVRIEGSKGHLELDEEGVIRVKLLGEKSYQHPYSHERRGFAGDCVYALQRHFVDALTNGTSFESTAEDYLKSVRLVEAAYTSAQANQVQHFGE